MVPFSSSISRQRGVLALGLVLVVGACPPAPASSSTPPAAAAPREPPTTAPAPAPPGAELPARPAKALEPEARAVVLIDDREQLSRLAEALDFGRMLFDLPGTTTKALRGSARYRHWVTRLELHGEGAGTFSPWWIGHPRTSFVLVGVANRLDRRDSRSGACGETRLLHRLAYRDGDELRYLPMAVNVVLRQPDDGEGCRAVARSWMVAPEVDPVQALAAEGGPLHPDRLGLDHLLAVETNVRIGDEDHEHLGGPGGGVNELRVFTLDASEGWLVPAQLELQPYGKLLLVRRDVIEWLSTPGIMEDIERGTATIPRHWEWDWANVAVSGSDSHASPFSAMWQRPGVLERITLPADGPISTKDGLTHRLDGMSCEGCHEARSVAGFHLPGEGDRLQGGASAHLRAELPWRVAYVEALARGEEPELRRRLHDDGPPGFGRRCSRAGSPVAGMRCDAGYACVEVPGRRFGACLPEGYDGPAPCDAAEPGCRRPSAWFPGGFLARSCEAGQACAAVPTPADAARCRGTADPWACAEARAERVIVDRCEDQAGCRDGYACVRAEDGGVCMPVATVPELRISGHATRLR